jgi:hypothetical protein
MNNSRCGAAGVGTSASGANPTGNLTGTQSGVVGSALGSAAGC